MVKESCGTLRGAEERGDKEENNAFGLESWRVEYGAVAISVSLLACFLGLG